MQSPELTRYLIEKGMDVNATFKLPEAGGAEVTLPLLMLALTSSSNVTARMLIELGADTHVRDSLGRTALATAALYRPEAIEPLLASGVNINEQTPFGTPLLIAARHQWPYSERALLSFASSQHKPQFDQQPNPVKILIEKGADPNTRDGAGRNALMVMSMEPRAGEDLETVIETLKKLDPRLREGRSHKTVELIGELLLNAGCDVNAADNKGRAPLMYAAASGRSGVVNLLLKRGANVRAKDHNGESALDWAIKSGDDKTVRLLSLLSPSEGKKPLRPRLEVFDQGVIPPHSFPGRKKAFRE